MIYRCPYCRVNVEISSEHHANFPCPLCGRRFCSFCETPAHFPAFCGEARVWYAITEARPANASFPIQSGLRYSDNTERTKRMHVLFSLHKRLRLTELFR